MRKLLLIVGVLAALFAGGYIWWSQSKPAALAVGDTAPSFATKGALNGQPFDANLDALLKKGPLVLYFFPKVFTKGCTLEAREFAEKTPEFNALGASIIGMSGDDLAGLTKFSAEECRDKFAVAQAKQSIIDDYGVAMAPVGGMTNRTSFVIDQQGKIRFIHSAMDYKDHVRLTLAAVKELQAGKAAQ